MFLLTFAVWVYLYARRIPFIRSRAFTASELMPAAFAQLSPPEVCNPSDNFKNLFEMPVIFYALALYLFVTNQVDSTYVAAAWIFYALRAMHSAVHCTFNLIILRFYLYAISSMALFFIALRAALAHFAG